MTMATDSTSSATPRLKKNLGLFDVFAISTGAMFSSGFFLLPGLAAAAAGPSVVLAYFIAAVLILPAMLSMAELSTAMPRAGGAYYFLDRSLGPVVGTIGGIGTWIALILKSAFALIGMGAYLALFFDVPIQSLAVGLTIFFTLVNLVGAKESSRLQGMLVVVLLGVLLFFLVQGFFEVVEIGFGEVTRTQFTPFMPFGLEGLAATVGLVFVSYAGLTKVASVAEEVQNADRNIPLGMTLSLIVATVSYVFGVYVIVAVLDPVLLHEDLTPVATAAEAFFDWLPAGVGLILIVAAAIAAFASTGNAGIMSASRYLFAMARDHVIWPRFAEVGRFRTPTLALGLTAAVMILCLLTLDVMSVAKLASAFQLLIFSLVNLSVIVLRESRIEGYEPGFRSPFYPWLQYFGALASLWLITEMGALPVLFTLGLIGASLLWYRFYASRYMAREGAVFHLFERLGKRRDPGLDRELREVLKESTGHDRDPFADLVTDARVLDVEGPARFEPLIWRTCSEVAKDTSLTTDEIANRFLDEVRAGLTPVARGVALPHLRLEGLSTPLLYLVRIREPLHMPGPDPIVEGADREVHALFVLISPQRDVRAHLNLLARLAGRADDDSFMEEWLAAEDEQDLKEALLHNDRFLSLHLEPSGPTADLVDREVRNVSLVPGALIALVHREGDVIVPGGRTSLHEGDRLTIVGSVEAIRTLTERFGAG
jgi:amino acid transporter/mannitol/fructose-specific phosphotransferase system IIA component (Ntr-type)